MFPVWSRIWEEILDLSIIVLLTPKLSKNFTELMNDSKTV